MADQNEKLQSNIKNTNKIINNKNKIYNNIIVYINYFTVKYH